MLKKNETNPYEDKEIKKTFKKAWRRACIIGRKWSKIFIKWLFFYQPENNMDAIIHIGNVIVWLYLTYVLVIRGGW